MSRGLPSAEKYKDKSRYVKMPRFLQGTKGANYVSRAMRPGGYAEGGTIRQGLGGLTEFFDYDGSGAIERPVKEDKLGQSTGIQTAGIPAAIRSGKIRSGEKSAARPGVVDTGGNRVGARGNGIAQRGRTRGRLA